MRDVTGSGKRRRWYPRLSRVNYGSDGRAVSMSFYVVACAGEPTETFERRDADPDRFTPWTHGLAVYVAANGCDEPLLLCPSCADAWRDETERLARVRRLPPSSRAWLADRGVNDWSDTIRSAPLGPAPDIRVGDVVTWHPELEMSVSWHVVAVHKNGRATIETDVPEGQGTRTIARTVMTRDCQVTARPAGVLL